jgi:VWFA-related protein
MRPIAVFAVALSAPLIVVTAAPAPSAQAPPARAATPPPPSQPTIGVTAAEVAVDFVVRDAKGRIVRDLKPTEVEVYEDGVRQGVALFKLMSATPEPVAQPDRGAATAAPERSEPTPPTGGAAAGSRLPPAAPGVEREALVALVFDRLSPSARPLAHDAAVAWLKLPAVPGRLVGVYRIDTGLDEVQPFTDDRDLVMGALERVARSLPTTFRAAEDRERLRTLRQQRALLDGSVVSATTPVSAPESAGELVVPGTRPAPAGLLGYAMREEERRALEVEIAMLGALEELESQQQGLATTGGLLALVNGLSTFPGRKAVVFFSEGLVLPERVVATLGSVISAANRGGVSFYAADAAGLRVRSSAEETRRELAVIADASSSWTGPISRRLEHNEDVLRLDPASGLDTLSRDTGGFLIRDTNDIAAALRRVEEELGAYYLLSYAPRNEVWDGRFRRIELRVRRPGVTVQSRRGYYAVRTPTPTPVLEHEAAALASLEESPNAADLPVHARALHFPAPDGDAVVAITAEMAAGAAGRRAGKSGDLAQDFTVLALVRDASGRVVHKSSRRYDLAWPKSKIEELRRWKAPFEREALLGPGRYTVEVVAYDALRRASGVTRSQLVVPRRPPGTLRLGSLVVVGRSEPNAAGDPGPLRYEGRQLYPDFGEAVRVSSGKPLSFLVTLAPGARPPGEARVELLLEDEAVRSAEVPLPPPDEDGTVRVVGRLPIEGLPGGAYTLRVVVTDGQTLETGTAPVTLSP